MALPSFLGFFTVSHPPVLELLRITSARADKSVSLSRLVAELRLAAAMDDIGQYVD